jgi:3-hydroxyisobutyrate dehydrogenase
MSERISFLGIGQMGAPMAERLVAAGRNLILWNRTRAKAEAIAGARG